MQKDGSVSMRFQIVDVEDEGVQSDYQYVRDTQTGKRLTAGLTPMYADDLCTRLNQAITLLKQYEVEL